VSKKKFLDGLESLFGHASDDNLSEDSPLLSKEKPKGRSKVKVTRRRRKGASSKNFTSDLDSLFEDALQETMQEHAHKITKGLDAHTLSTKKRNRKPLSGLDALIRNTSDVNFEHELQESIRRVSFAFDAKKYKKLKNIAKEEKAYIKDILSRIITDYLKNHEKGNRSR
jgi:hypothetical protein